MSDKYEGITHVVHVSTGVGTACDECHASVGGDLFEFSVNHYIGDHGYRLLHVGSEWGAEDHVGSAINYTVAVLGR